MDPREKVVPLSSLTGGGRAPLDTLRRPIHDLRISVMDRCNFRCPYCMPRETFHESYRFLKSSERLDFAEILRLARVFVRAGVRKIRITGGEPLLRPNLPDLIGDLTQVPDIEDIALTTNGMLLAKYATELKAAGLNRITVSLDTLDPEVFAKMSGGFGGVGEVLLALPRRRLERTLGVALAADDLHPLAAASGRGLDDERVSDLVAERRHLVRRADGVHGAGDDRHACVAHHPARCRLRPHQLDRVGRRPDPRQPRLLDHPGERCVLGEESVAGVDRLGARAKRGLDEHVAAQVALGGRTGADEVRLVRGANVRAPPVGLRVDPHTTDPELAERAEHTDRDLAAVRHEHLRERRHAARILPEP